MSTLKFLHAADLHLGRQFSGLLRTTEDIRAILRHAGYHAWAQLVDTAVRERVQFVALAGDVFHDANPPIGARIAFKRGLEKLSEAGIPVYLALGNHDPLRTFPDSFHTMPGLHIFPAEPQYLEPTSIEFDRGVVISGASFEKAAVTENLVRRFTRDPGIDFAIGVLHTNVSGSVGHRDYAPCTLDDLLAAGMNAWCLGHVHSARILWQDPLVLYSGASQAAHPMETGPKGCWLVTVSDRGSAVPQFVPLARVLWETAEIRVAGLSGPEDVIPLAEDVCSTLLSENDGLQALVVNIRITGERPEWHTKPISDNAEIRELMAERLTGLALPVCLAALSDQTRSSADLDTLQGQDGFLGDLLKLCLESGQDPLSVQDIKQEMRGELVRKVSPALLDPLLESLLDCQNDTENPNVFRKAAELAASTFFDTADRKK